jgi:hypothetical protein
MRLTCHQMSMIDETLAQPDRGMKEIIEKGYQAWLTLHKRSTEFGFNGKKMEEEG